MGSYEPSSYQVDIYNQVQRGRGDIMVNAKAGSGKTATLEDIVDQIRGKSLFCCFNLHIKQYAQKKFGKKIRVSTIHGFGFFQLIRKYVDRGSKREFKVESSKYRGLAAEYVQYTISPPLRAAMVKDKNARAIVKAREKALFKLCDVARITLTKIDDLDALRALIARFGIELDSKESEECVVRGVAPVIARGMEMVPQLLIDYTDMLYAPIVLLAPYEIEKFDWVLIDEAQDLNTAQRRLMLMARGLGGRYVWVGDEHQAIMGFAGADAQSFWNIAQETRATVMDLPICWRCPSSHLDLARIMVPSIQDRPNAPQGTIDYISRSLVPSNIDAGALVIGRKTAPLVRLCMDLIAKNLPARVRGRDIGRSLIDLAEVIFEIDAPFLTALGNYETAQRARLIEKEDSEEALMALGDKCEALRVVYLNIDAMMKFPTLADVTQRIMGMFADEDASIWLSTVHRAKGLEAQHVFILEPQFIPFDHPKQSAADAIQEGNLYYVSVTRSLDRMTIILDDGARQPLTPAAAFNLIDYVA